MVKVYVAVAIVLMLFLILAHVCQARMVFLLPLQHFAENSYLLAGLALILISVLLTHIFVKFSL